MTPKVELVFDRDCPNVAGARGNLVRALTAAGVPARWTEWDRASPETPARVRGFGSPAILVDGRDVAGAAPLPEGAGCCRLYPEPGGASRGAPSVETIARTLAASASGGPAPVPGANSRRGAVLRLLPILPAVGIVLLPKLACPACWPAYAGLLASVGLGFLVSTAYLLPLTAAFLAVALGVLGFGISRRGYGPFVLGLAASPAILVGKFVLDSNAAMFGGVGLLVIASLWNSWPRMAAASCPQCPPGEGTQP